MKDNVTDWALYEYRAFYKDDAITKEDIFYYTYGILHHSGYRKKYQKSLVRGLSHIPMVPDFWAFSRAGRKLAALHLNYETCKRHDLKEPLAKIPDNPVSIVFGKLKSGMNDYSTFIVNRVKVYDNLPEVNYKVSGRIPVDWLTVMLKKSDSGIDRRPFRYWTGEHLRETIERLVYVGLESDRIIADLSKLEFKQTGQKPCSISGQVMLEGY